MAQDLPVEQWAGDRAARWVAQSAGLERQLAPVSAHLFSAARLAPGESVLDVGCGTGPTTREAAVAVGPTGRVSGLDVSSEMLAAATGIEAPDGAAPLDWIEADAVAWDPPRPPPYDVVLSRFGVMFFTDPSTAFTNLGRATRPGGRLVVAVWAPRDDSELFSVPLEAALTALHGRGIEPDVPAVDHGPFSLHDAAEVHALLTGAGWSSVEVTPHVVALSFGGGLPPAPAAATAIDFGPTRIVTNDVDDDARAAVVEAITEAFVDHVDAAGDVALDGHIRIVRAERPA